MYLVLGKSLKIAFIDLAMGVDGFRFDYAGNRTCRVLELYETLALKNEKSGRLFIWRRCIIRPYIELSTKEKMTIYMIK